MSAAVALPEFLAIKWQQIPLSIYWRIGFVVLGTTFITYLLMMYAIRHLQATALSVFTYIQPIIGILFALAVGADQMNATKWLAIGFVLVGVYLVTKRERPLTA
jgi:drug/metabolite transporter (DMT)-like permease